MTDNDARFEIERLRLENEQLRVQLRKKQSNKLWLWVLISAIVIMLIVFSDVWIPLIKLR
ncbi:hypothetical protein [Vagococcus bubulae]|uniref:Uncharacterized protein n=1 Tax=Vagococcus bubulae TaxID=1977868 RepID=A0A429ZA32_9ENTE|nr:hypothetical protein [Vagococcus bubulae]RST90552.1 hypothetical protein CBF36_11625 [Vagococcus bubulae]